MTLKWNSVTGGGRQGRRLQGEVDCGPRVLQGVGGEDDHPGGVLEQAGRQRGRAQLLGGGQGERTKNYPR